ncbi:MAG: PilZ domain-containing protein, partial [Bdellovibrionota bacterium]|nr:PilZ domain-containing protein [Bdellovibrionota bacterium]
ERALELLRRGVHVDAIVSDIRMPGGMDGIELMRTIQSESIRIPVNILMSGHAILDPDEIEKLKVSRCLNKPFSVKKLKKILDDSFDESPAEGVFTRRFPREQKEVGILNEDKLQKSFDLSLGGVFIQTKMKLGVGSVFRVKLDINEPIMVDLKVKWIREEQIGNKPPGLGCEFVNLSKENADKIFNFLEEPKTESFFSFSETASKKKN